MITATPARQSAPPRKSTRSGAMRSIAHSTDSTTNAPPYAAYTQPKYAGSVPHALVGVQLGSVGREELHVQPWDAAAEVADHRASVDPPVVPQDDHRPSQVAEQVAKEGAQTAGWRMFVVCNW